MNVVDIILGIFILVVAIRGLIRGIIREVFGLAALFVGVFVSHLFGKNFGHYIASHLTVSPVVAYAFGFFSIFVGVYLVLLFMGYIISSILKKIELGWLDRLLGFIFGLLKAVFFIAIFIFVFESFPFLRGLDNQFNKSSYIYAFIRQDIVNKTDIVKIINRFRVRKIGIGPLKGPVFIVEDRNA